MMDDLYMHAQAPIGLHIHQGTTSQMNLTHGSHSEAKRKADNEVVEMESEKEGNKRQMQQELDNTRTALREELSFNASATVRRKSTTRKKNK